MTQIDPLELKALMNMEIELTHEVAITAINELIDRNHEKRELLERIAELEAQVARLTAVLAGQNLKVTEFYVDEAGEWHRVGGDT